ncbi:zonula occludens toxin [Herbaspirillum sp. HC18]|nr:zonula occludens toxin [Herbaspirillum sp. HC18]
MPINVYTGLMRSGKTYEVVSEVIVPAVLSGRDVVTNTDGISEERIHAYLSEKHPAKDSSRFGRIRHVSNEDVFKPDFLPYYDDGKAAHTDTIVQPGDLVCIDEGWRFWGTDCKLHKHHKSFFLEHGHFTHPETGVACDLVLMIQDMGTLHRFVKNVVAFSFRTHKKVSLGMSNTYSVTMWEGYKQTKYSSVGNWVRRYNKAIFPLYSSFKGGADGKLVNADARQNILKNKGLWILIALVAFVGVVGVLGVRWFFNGSRFAGNTQESAKTAQGASSPTPANKSSSIPEKSPSARFNESWRIVGRYMTDGQSWVVVANSIDRLRIDSPSRYSNQGMATVGEIDGERVTVWSGAVPQEGKK